MNRFEEYIPRDDLKNATHLEIKVYYSKGSGSMPRGFYAGVSPVTKTGISISCDILAGRRQLLMEVSRYTDKQFDTALTISKEVLPAMIERVLAENKAA
jgi:hypothetical protein